MRHAEPFAAPHRVIPAQAEIQTHPQRAAGQSVQIMVTDCSLQAGAAAPYKPLQTVAILAW